MHGSPFEDNAFKLPASSSSAILSIRLASCPKERRSCRDRRRPSMAVSYRQLPRADSPTTARFGRASIIRGEFEDAGSRGFQPHTAWRQAVSI